MMKRTNVLSIDDSRSVHAFLEKCLQELKLETLAFVHALSVREGLERLQENRNSIGLILLDWEMPEMTGLEGLPLLRNAAPELPIVMLTSKNEISDIETILAAGAKDYMMKPITPDILRDKLAEYLRI